MAAAAEPGCARLEGHSEGAILHHMITRRSAWRPGRGAAAPLVLALLLALVPRATAHAQDWHTDRVGPIRVHWSPPNASAFEALEPVLTEAVDHIASELGRLDSVDLYLAPDRRAFRDLVGPRLPDWGAGCAFPAQGRIFVHLEQRDPAALRRTLVHELAHLSLFRAAGRARLPRWFDEGVAMWLAREWQHRQSLAMGVAVLADRVHSLEELESLLGFPESEARRAYAESFSAALFLHKVGGPGIWAELLEAVQETGSFDQALKEVLGKNSGDFDRAWQRHVRREDNPLRLLFDTGLLWLGILGLAVLAYALTRLRARQLERDWEAEEQLDRQEQEREREAPE